MPGASWAPPHSPDTPPLSTCPLLASYLWGPEAGESQVTTQAGPHVLVVPGQMNSRLPGTFLSLPELKSSQQVANQPTGPGGGSLRKSPPSRGRASLPAQLALGWPWMNESPRSACLGLCQEPRTAPCSFSWVALHASSKARPPASVWAPLFPASILGKAPAGWALSFCTGL